MKVRNGFVSNSSSSSFIVALPSIPGSIEELKAMLFGDDETYPNPYPWDDRAGSWSTKEVAETVWNDFKRKGLINVEEAAEVGMSGYLSDAEYPEYPSVRGNDDNWREAWEEYESEKHDADRKVVTAFLQTIPEGHVLATFTYSDNDGEYFTALEHGTLFDRLPHLRISHH